MGSSICKLDHTRSFNDGYYDHIKVDSASYTFKSIVAARINKLIQENKEYFDRPTCKQYQGFKISYTDYFYIYLGKDLCTFISLIVTNGKTSVKCIMDGRVFTEHDLNNVKIKFIDIYTEDDNKTAHICIAEDCYVSEIRTTRRGAEIGIQEIQYPLKKYILIGNVKYLNYEHGGYKEYPIITRGVVIKGPKEVVGRFNTFKRIPFKLLRKAPRSMGPISFDLNGQCSFIENGKIVRTGIYRSNVLTDGMWRINDKYYIGTPEAKNYNKMIDGFIISKLPLGDSKKWCRQYYLNGECIKTEFIAFNQTEHGDYCRKDVFKTAKEKGGKSCVVRYMKHFNVTIDV